MCWIWNIYEVLIMNSFTIINGTFFLVSAWLCSVSMLWISIFFLALFFLYILQFDSKWYSSQPRTHFLVTDCYKRGFCFWLAALRINQRSFREYSSKLQMQSDHNTSMIVDFVGQNQLTRNYNWFLTVLLI